MLCLQGLGSDLDTLSHTLQKHCHFSMWDSGSFSGTLGLNTEQLSLHSALRGSPWHTGSQLFVLILKKRDTFQAL